MLVLVIIRHAFDKCEDRGPDSQDVYQQHHLLPQPKVDKGPIRQFHASPLSEELMRLRSSISIESKPIDSVEMGIDMANEETIVFC